MSILALEVSLVSIAHSLDVVIPRAFRPEESLFVRTFGSIQAEREIPRRRAKSAILTGSPARLARDDSEVMLGVRFHARFPFREELLRLHSRVAFRRFVHGCD